MSILLVLAYHLAPTIAPGGFVGVDVFFVISGFLITGLVRRGLELGDFRVGDFYARRVRRLFPALLVVLFATFAAGWAVLLPTELAELGEHIAGGAGFGSNFVMWRESGYFDQDVVRKPLMHLWSLGVEEQFYLVWPWLLLAAWRVRHRGPWVPGVVVAASFAVAAWLTLHHPTAAFYAPWTRMWELAAGATLAWAGDEVAWASRASPASRSLLSALGLCLIVGTGLLGAPGPYAPFVATLVATTGAWALLGSGTDAAVNRLWLSNGALGWIGELSFSLYLWHWPLLSLATVLGGGATQASTRAAVALAAVILAAATERFVERPFLRSPATAARVAGLGAAMIVAGGVGAITAARDGFPSRFPPGLQELLTPMPAPDWREAEGCFLQSDRDETQFGPGCVDTIHRPLVLVWGDSTAAALYPGLAHLAERTGLGVGQWTSSVCPPLLRYQGPQGSHCASINRFVLERIRALRPDVVVLHSLWTYDLQGLPDLTDTIAAVRAAGVPRVVVLGPVPEWEGGLVQVVFDHMRLSRGVDVIPERLSTRVVGADLDRRLRERVRGSDGVYVSAWDALCSAKGCLVRTGAGADTLTAFDSYHLTEAGSIALLDHIAPSLWSDPPDQATSP